jgi:hypothetical protein
MISFPLLISMMSCLRKTNPLIPELQHFFCLPVFPLVISQPLTIVWLKRDLRWWDHQALKAAIDAQNPLLVVFSSKNPGCMLPTPTYGTSGLHPKAYRI